MQTCKLAVVQTCKLAILLSHARLSRNAETTSLRVQACFTVFFMQEQVCKFPSLQTLQVCKFALRSKFASLQSCGRSKFASLQVCTRSKFASWHQQQVCKFSSFGRQNLDGIRVGRSCITSSSRVSSCKARYPQHPIFNCRNLKEYIRVPGGHKRHLLSPKI